MNFRIFRLIFIGLLINVLMSSCNGVKPQATMPTSREFTTIYSVFAADHKRATECINLTKDVSIQVERKSADQCISSMVSYDQIDCRGSAEKVVSKGFWDQTMQYSFPLAPNYACAETLTGRSASPCVLKEITSGGTPYRICTHDGRRVPLSSCENHTGACADH